VEEDPMSDDERQERQEDRALFKVMLGSIVGLVGVVAVLAVTAVVVVGNSGTTSARQAAGAPVALATAAARTVTVAMHDPGCHWFQVGPNSFEKSATVKDLSFWPITTRPA
jgi:anti-sigma-K factor RskA